MTDYVPKRQLSAPTIQVDLKIIKYQITRDNTILMVHFHIVSNFCSDKI